ncbi:MAG: hypothetical protein IJL75_01675 [Eubacterium sp.]|nr:hypothetical protein [Eubacterium sp.]
MASQVNDPEGNGASNDVTPVQTATPVQSGTQTLTAAPAQDVTPVQQGNTMRQTVVEAVEETEIVETKVPPVQKKTETKQGTKKNFNPGPAAAPKQSKSMEFVAKKRKSIITFSFIICILAVAAVGGYYQFMKRQQMQSEVKAPTTELEKLIAKDLDVGYPETPTEVMKLWGRLNQCIYNTKLDDDEFDALLKQLRTMYSSDLLAQNSEEEHRKNLENEVEQFKNDKKKILSYSAETGQKVKYKNIKGRDCANLSIRYFMNTGKRSYAKTFQDFILVSEDGKWKILGFKNGEEQTATKEEATGEQA